MTAFWDIREVAWPDDVVGTVSAFASRDEMAWLDCAVSGLEDRFSLVSAAPQAFLEQYEGRPARLWWQGRQMAEDAVGWRLWRKMQDRLPVLEPSPLNLSPGWVGYVGFEMARQLERLPARRHETLGLPLMRLGLYTSGVVLDHVERRAWAVAAVGLDAFEGPRAEETARRWERAVCEPACLEPCAPARACLEWSRDEYERAVERALAYIAAGDVYQVNLAQRLRLTWEQRVDPMSVHAAVRERNPAGYAALLSWNEGAVVSASPELFLKVHGRDVLTRPIKGTRPRTGNPEQDEANRAALLASPKEAAELAMIVDLHRNDLGRVCAYGTVQVRAPRRLEVHPTVYHTVAEVCGRLAPGRDGLGLLAACFPAGSVTGVPKIRAMEIIDELEPVARGAYTGAVGVLGLDCGMTWNVAIRTLQIRGDTATLYVGGGIVADSDPVAEYEETLAKGRGILAATTGGTAREPASPVEVLLESGSGA